MHVLYILFLKCQLLLHMLECSLNLLAIQCNRYAFSCSVSHCQHGSPHHSCILQTHNIICDALLKVSPALWQSFIDPAFAISLQEVIQGCEVWAPWWPFYSMAKPNYSIWEQSLLFGHHYNCSILPYVPAAHTIY